MEIAELLHIMDSALVYERAGFNGQAIQEWQSLIDAINDFNANRDDVFEYGIAVKELANEHIRKLEE